MKRHFLFAFFFLIGVLSIAFWFFRSEDAPRDGGRYVTIAQANFSVEIAKTPMEQERGLGYRDALCEMCGMLFLFDRADRYGFWMKGMRFPLDILWIRDGTIVHIERAVSHVDQQTVYTPDEPADRVFEIHAGMSDRFRIQVGDKVSFLGDY